jgi:hypothetical protein
VFVLAYCINGVGLALQVRSYFFWALFGSPVSIVQDAQANGFVAALKDHAEAKMGLLHAAYGEQIIICVYESNYLQKRSLSLGAGALASPLAATQFAQLNRWSFHYLVSLGIACSNTLLLIAVFRFKTQDGKFTFILPI